MSSKVGRPPMFDKAMVKFALTMPEELIAHLGQVGAEREMSRSEVIRRFCRFVLKNPSLMQMALALRDQ